MPSSRREQELARARAVRRAQRDRERARRRRVITFVALGAMVVGGTTAGIVIALSSGADSKSTVTAASPTTAPVSKTACNGPAESPAPAIRTWKAEPPLTIDPKAGYRMKLDTSCGPIVVTLDAAKAPHTVNLLAFLADHHFYNGTRCHRSTDVSSLTVLQCGDPTGTGSGSIGFTIAEENLAGAKYVRGTFAMAKTSAPHSTSSQFFLVDKDSTLPPDYTVAGHITSGLDVLDKLVAIGNDGSNGQGDGAPKQDIYLNTVTVTKT